MDKFDWNQTQLKFWFTKKLCSNQIDEGGEFTNFKPEFVDYAQNFSNTIASK